MTNSVQSESLDSAAPQEIVESRLIVSISIRQAITLATVIAEARFPGMLFEDRICLALLLKSLREIGKYDRETKVFKICETTETPIVLPDGQIIVDGKKNPVTRPVYNTSKIDSAFPTFTLDLRELGCLYRLLLAIALNTDPTPSTDDVLSIIEVASWVGLDAALLKGINARPVAPFEGDLA